MRGKLFAPTKELLFDRNIPAYAGKTQWRQPSGQRIPEHPRVCGENSSDVFEEPTIFGTSPRMRGKLGKYYPKIQG